MFDHEIERALGYTPCVCGVIDGTWHPKCYVGKTQEQLAAGYKVAFRNARRHLKREAEAKAQAAINAATQHPGGGK